MRRRQYLDDLGELDERPRIRSPRALLQEECVQDEDTSPVADGDRLAGSLAALCSRFGLEAWASPRDERGLWGFGDALSDWLRRAAAERRTGSTFQLEAIRLLTNLLVILGAVIHTPPDGPSDACQLSLTALNTARRLTASNLGPVASFPGAARAMERIVRVRGWSRLTMPQQTVAEALLDLYLETLSATVREPAPEAILTASDAWLTVLHLRALPVGFDERLLRAASWYLDSFVSSRP